MSGEDDKQDKKTEQDEDCPRMVKISDKKRWQNIPDETPGGQTGTSPIHILEEGIQECAEN